jgi:hypothetical protein
MFELKPHPIIDSVRPQQAGQDYFRIARDPLRALGPHWQISEIGACPWFCKAAAVIAILRICGQELSGCS